MVFTDTHELLTTCQTLKDRQSKHLTKTQKLFTEGKHEKSLKRQLMKKSHLQSAVDGQVKMCEKYIETIKIESAYLIMCIYVYIYTPINIFHVKEEVSFFAH